MSAENKSKSLRDRLQEPRVRTVDENDIEQNAEIYKNEFFGIERRFRRSAMLDLRMKGGVFASFPYSYITKILFDPSNNIEIFVADSLIKIKGRNLHNIYVYLTQHRVSYIKENMMDIDISPEKEPFVSSIKIESI